MLDIFDRKISIFEILCNEFKYAKEKYGVNIHWYIMTSEENNDETENFFVSNNYFEYGRENISFFKQGQLPMLDEDGKVILESKHSIKLAGDGNGGIFKAMSKEVLDEMKENGIEWVYVSGIDNILAEIIDPLLIGLTISNNFMLSSKTVIKEEPNEKTGVYCKKNGKPAVIEYTEISEELRNKRKSNGELELCEVNIVSNLFNIKLLEEVKRTTLPYHVAHKKCDYVDDNGDIKEALQPNAYKFETFIFDVYNYIDDILLLRVKREDEFAPVKNKEGADSPDTATKMYEKKYAKI